MKTKAGFTLIELVMVIVILAIISSLAVTKFGSMREDSARKVSIANQQAISRAVETYLAVNHGTELNRLDSLIDEGTPVEGTEGFDFDARSGNDTVGGLYRGPVDLGELSRATVEEKNRGIHENLLDFLCLYRISEVEAKAFHRIGLEYVMRHNTYATGKPYDRYGHNDDGSIPQEEDGLDPAASACMVRTVTNGMAFAVINPKTDPGRLVYQSCGQELLLTREAGQSYTDQEVTDQVAATGGPLLVLGLGERCSMIGKTHAGLETAPYSEALPLEYYRQYLLLFRLRKTGAMGVNSVVAEFAGTLDPEGNTIHSARKLLR